MLTYGGIGLLIAGLLFTFFAGKIVKDAAKAAQAKKNGPILAVVGAAMLGLATYLGGGLS